jgi:hypothetical protein
MAPEPLRFSILGTIVTCDAFGRCLRIGGRDVWVVPGVSMAGLAPGARVTASGYQEDLTARWIVTDLQRAGDIPWWPRCSAPMQAWVTIEGCLCGGFFVWKISQP